MRIPKTPPNGGALVGAARPVSGSGATSARCELERLAVTDMCVKLAAVKRTRTGRQNWEISRRLPFLWRHPLAGARKSTG